MVSQRRKINSILSASWLLSSVLLLYILLLCSCRVDYCYATDTLKQGEWITDNGTTLVSSEGTFELGFFTPIRSSTHKRFIGIWYHKLDEQIVVWVANRDNPVLDGSIGIFGIAENGSLIISETSRKEHYWSTSPDFSSTNQTVKLMDSGNLVLSDDDQLGTSLWESFQYPTDTFLPGMKMDENLKLISWTSDGDPRSGQFTFKQDQEGESRYDISKKPRPLVYWRSWYLSQSQMSIEMPITTADLLSNVTRFTGTVRTGTGTGSKGHTGIPAISCKTKPQYSKCIADLKNSNDSYTRLVMNSTGELQYYQNGDFTWMEPEDKCSIDNACGNFGSCNVNNKLVCKCLPGFQPANQGNWNSRDFLDGCTRNWKSYDKSDKFLSLTMMRVSDSDSYLEAKNESECRKECLDNSQCQAYSYDLSSSQRPTRTYKCWIWTSDLRNLQELYTNGRDLSVRVAKSVIGRHSFQALEYAVIYCIHRY